MNLILPRRGRQLLHQMLFQKIKLSILCHITHMQSQNYRNEIKVFFLDIWTLFITILYALLTFLLLILSIVLLRLTYDANYSQPIKIVFNTT